MSKLNIIFMGTPDFSIPPLEALIKAGHDIIAVYTQPPKPKDRGHALTPTPIHAFAETKGLPVYHPTSLKAESEQVIFKDLGADLAIVSAYGLILPKAILEAPRYGCMNIHFSLLPRWRGAAPIQRSILAGDAKTGITIMQMDEGLDTGDILLMKDLPITGDTTAQNLVQALSPLASELIVEAVQKCAEGKLNPLKQDEAQANYAHKLKKEEGQFKWTDKAAAIDLKFRAFLSWPGVFFEHQGEMIKVHGLKLHSENQAEPGNVLSLDPLIIACATGALELINVQRPNRSRISGAEFARGLHLKSGDSILSTAKAP